MENEKICRLVDRVVNCSTWDQKKKRARNYLSSLNDSFEKSRLFVYFLDTLAKKDILIASYVSGKEGRHIVTSYLPEPSNNLDIIFVECCLFMGFYGDLVKYMMRHIDSLEVEDIHKIISDIREKTDYVCLLRFLRVLNAIDCKKDYVDDVFWDCPIDTPEFQTEERIFCQELFNRGNYLVLYDYLTTREHIDDITDLLRRSREELNGILLQNLDVGSILLLLCDKGRKNISSFEYLITTLTHSDIDRETKSICIFLCCLNASRVLGNLCTSIESTLKGLKCDSKHLLKYRKYIGHDEILCFKKFLAIDMESISHDGRFLLNFISLIGDNNTFCTGFREKESIKPFISKNKKYLQDNKKFADQLRSSTYSNEEKEFIRNNTHLSMYTGLLE